MNDEQLRSIIAGVLLGFISPDGDVRSRSYDLLAEIGSYPNFRAEVIGALYEKLNANRKSPDAYRYIRSLSLICANQAEHEALVKVIGEMIPNALPSGDLINLQALLNAIEKIGRSAAPLLPLLVAMPNVATNPNVRAASAAAVWAILKP